jgi:regulatory protein YycH of two-component signal transduction system YycFG
MVFSVHLVATRTATSSRVERIVKIVAGYQEYAEARATVDLEYELGPEWTVEVLQVTAN